MSDGYLYHEGTGKWVVAQDSTGGQEDGNQLVLWSNYHSQTSMGDDFNTFMLVDGHLLHRGLGKWVVAKDSTGNGGDGNPLVLWSNFYSQSSEGNQYNSYSFIGVQ
ncbi:hypothetical protein OV079_11710 [Nannocystis pusilla]|uniref:Uncharacterized protein n=1 Tax=Nannocystis pusilla TaxID=889268 RepID=A0A9X3ELE5_9BACT|nr:hypothetical protein [Nannocystis pusilla]MCY1006214.1 hypothetical protein [Nannocystis pusilla]